MHQGEATTPEVTSPQLQRFLHLRLPLAGDDYGTKLPGMCQDIIGNDLGTPWRGDDLQYPEDA